MLGRSIRFRALENKLQLLWAKRGVLNIIDLGQEFHLVTFTIPEDQSDALLEGPWMIYDHYLTGGHFKIKYKGLHLLYLKYGKYGHYVEGCGTQMEVGMYREGGTKFGPNGKNSSEPHNKEQEA
ncbi:hypothetical protein KIW84_051431 [Lathyrus oleraceus]|uniref:DUF4283 domain-containing protein n=1 Tax=Pisum sativum TaxID=3888 RepID=A0A9D5ADN8_PEA|nr:hypothetical protein KIW84_051431 [Pisum sativum]